MTESILKKLEKTREKMIRSGIENGFSNVETIRLSKKLDQLLNAYQMQNNHDTKKEYSRNIELIKQ
ncbi:aspartyl-phosphate phosphatase Spo0E family protein [Rummeliibacillus suwonensis]|jgi:hypothetical protein|uniref:aspartyl-phosphate phosphatase Spo0E family protein n=1 Tax=Rummeliibacillus suwonensis TaxID=1306154 RepID=UPI0011B3BD98|nr:aspartyl-phosphate phosphatase Spo0E family protein [Rummeliibacillus suwonensis]MBO2534381.1 aspartyl-phosphate phosphatase Spo0E family protein [Rummeliibacillus suwonensis]